DSGQIQKRRRRAERTVPRCTRPRAFCQRSTGLPRLHPRGERPQRSVRRHSVESAELDGVSIEAVVQFWISDLGFRISFVIRILGFDILREQSTQEGSEQHMSLFHHLDVSLTRRGVSRRNFLHHVSAGALAAGTLNFRDLMSVQAAELRKQGMSLILLWMQGGPSQFETFDPKPGTDNGGPTEAIDTAVPGIRIAKGWEKTAGEMKEIALIRSMTNKEGEHQRATYQMHTGYLPTGTVHHPSLGCAIAKEIAAPEHDLTTVVSVCGGRGPGGAIGAGFLGVDYEPFLVQNPGQLPQDVAVPVATGRFERRLGLLNNLEVDFAARGGEIAVADHKKLYAKTK